MSISCIESPGPRDSDTSSVVPSGLTSKVGLGTLFLPTQGIPWYYLSHYLGIFFGEIVSSFN